MDDNKLYLGIDYGGNAVKLGLVDTYGSLQGRQSWPTSTLVEKTDCRAFATKVGEFVHSMGVYSSEIGGVGLAIPGILSQEKYYVPNVTVNWQLLMHYLSNTFSKQDIATINDANAAALGEMWMGAGGNAHSALLVTLGSGIGSGLIVDGNVISGSHGAAGEIGHMSVVRDGRACRCGRAGCLEQYASARGIVRTFKEAGEGDTLDASRFSSFEPSGESDALAVFNAFEAGDPRAEGALFDMADKLGFALAQVSCVADPDIIMLGGGMAAGIEYFLDDLRSAYRRYCLPACASTEIRAAKLSNDAGVFGAARYAMVLGALDREQRDWFEPDFMR